MWQPQFKIPPFFNDDPLSAHGRQYHLFSNINISKERRNFKKLHDK